MGNQPVRVGFRMASVMMPPPLGNTGGKGETAPDRRRINLSLPEGVYQALDRSADMVGAPLAQVALACLMAGLPAWAEQVTACERLVRSGDFS